MRTMSALKLFPTMVYRRLSPGVGVALIALFLAWPTLYFPWSLVDDGLELQATQHLDQSFHSLQLSDLFRIESDRARPAYWLILWLQYILGGTQAVLHHAFRIVQFIWAGWLAVVLGRESFNSNLAGALAGILFVTNARGIQLWIRLGPQEPLLIIFLGTSLWLLMHAARAVQTGHRSTLWLISSLVFLSIGYFCKETAIVMLPISGAIWLLIGRRWPSPIRSRWRQITMIYLIANLILAVSLAGLLIYTFAHRSANSYSTLYSLSTLIHPAILAGVYMVWLLTPFMILAPLGVLAITVWRSFNIKATLDKLDTDRWSLIWLTWLICFFIIQLPWNLPQSYYILPMTFSLCLLLGLGLSAILVSLIHSANRQLLPWLVAPLILCFGVTVAYNIYWLYVDMQQRYAEHQTDIELVQFIAKTANPNNQLWFDLPPLGVETAGEVRAHLMLFYGWPHANVDFVTADTHPMSGDLVISLEPGTLRPLDDLPHQLHFVPEIEATIGGTARSYRVYRVRAITQP